MRVCLILGVAMIWAGAAMAQPAPTVVFLHGLGDGPDSFRGAIHRLDANVKSYADQRPDALEPLSPNQAAKDLHDRLQTKGIAPPYLLIGHSISGLYVLAFARAYPNEVAGLLLDDARLPGFDAACLLAALRNCKIPALLYAILPATQKAELDGAAKMLTTHSDPSQWDGIAMTLLVAGKVPIGVQPAFQNLWISHATSFAAVLPQARLVVVKESGHYIHEDAPQIFDEELAALIARLN